MQRLAGAFDPGERRRLFGFFGLVVLIHLVGWGALLTYGFGHPAFIALGGIAMAAGYLTMIGSFAVPTRLSCGADGILLRWLWWNGNNDPILLGADGWSWHEPRRLSSLPVQQRLESRHLDCACRS